MFRRAAVAGVVLCSLVSPLHTWAETAPILIPKKGDAGWTVTQVDSTRGAPSGYEGRTDISTLTAIGNAPETAGKRIVARFELGNEIKTCPNADGTAEGDGTFSLTIDSTSAQATGTTTQHVEMQTKGKYKGEVGDDAWVKNPVKAEIDYTYTLSGTMRASNGALATPAGSNVSQHLTFPFSVGGTMAAPSIGAFSGGDPTKGHYADAYGAGTALVYWAGVYYSVAQTRWRQPHTCVDVSFTPTSYTVRVIPGAKTTVDAEVKTKGGASVKGLFQNAQGYAGGSVTPLIGTSNGAPMKFTFTAPTQKVAKTGFSVEATSRAGIANGEWFAGLGTGWSGTISLTITNTGDAGENELQSWSNSSVTRVTATFKDGKGDASSYTEVHEMGLRRQKALRGGSVTLIVDSSDALDGAFSDTVPATVDVLYPSNGMYAIRVNAIFAKEGTAHAQHCNRNRGCQDSVQQLLLQPVPGIDGKVGDEPNHLRGSKTDTKTGTGYRGTGMVTTTITWDLAREGTGK